MERIESNSPASSADGGKILTLSETMELEARQNARLPEPEAELVAYHIKPQRDKAAAYREKAEQIGRFNIFKLLGRSYLRLSARFNDGVATLDEDNLLKQIDQYKVSKSSAAVKRLYNGVIDRAVSFEDYELACELEIDMYMDPVEAYDQRDNDARSPIAGLVEEISLIRSAPEASYTTHTLFPFSVRKGRPDVSDTPGSKRKLNSLILEADKAMAVYAIDLLGWRCVDIDDAPPYPIRDEFSNILGRTFVDDENDVKIKVLYREGLSYETQAGKKYKLGENIHFAIDKLRAPEKAIYKSLENGGPGSLT